MNMVDDATGKTLSLMDYGETTRAAFSLLKWCIMDAGIPASVYVDLKSLYISPKSLKEELVEPEWLTHFSKACKKLGIEVIKAYSAQGKGRVERSHGVYQDRFAKELKLKNIRTIEEANRFLSNGFINKLNKKFAKPAESNEDAHVPLTPGDDLDHILCWEYTRQVRNDWTIRFKNRHYQVKKTGIKVRPKQKITVKRHLSESISLSCKGAFGGLILKGALPLKPQDIYGHKMRGIEHKERKTKRRPNRPPHFVSRSSGASACTAKIG